MSKRREKAQRRARLRNAQKKKRKENKLKPKKKQFKEKPKKDKQSRQQNFFDDFEFDDFNDFSDNDEPTTREPEEYAPESNFTQRLRRKLFNKEIKKDKYKSLHPGPYSTDDFLDDMKRFARIQVRNADYVPWGDRNLGYNVPARQLDYYFFFRTEAKKGKFLVTDFEYYHLYFQELLNSVGTSSADEALFKLIQLYNVMNDPDQYFRLSDTGKSQFSENIFDFLVYHHLDIHKLELSQWLNIIHFSRLYLGIQLLIDSGEFDCPFAVINHFNEVDISKKSKFYNHNWQNFSEAIVNVFYLLDQLYRSEYKKPYLLKDGEHKYPIFLDAFEGDIIDKTRIDLNRTFYVKFYPSDLYELISSVIQEVENTFRDLNGIRGKLRKYKTDDWTKNVIKDFIRTVYFNNNYKYSGTLEPAKNYLKQLQSEQKITLDQSQLERLRSETEIVQELMEIDEETQESLVNPLELVEPLERFLSGLSRIEFSIIESIESALKNNTILNSKESKFIENEARRYLNQEFLINKDNGFVINEIYLPALNQIFNQKEKYPFLNPKENSAMNDLVSELEPIEQKFLSIILNNQNPMSELEELALNQMTMVEILFDSINDKALLYLDDIILENNEDNCPEIIDEYKIDLMNNLE